MLPRSHLHSPNNSTHSAISSHCDSGSLPVDRWHFPPQTHVAGAQPIPSGLAEYEESFVLRCGGLWLVRAAVAAVCDATPSRLLDARLGCAHPPASRQTPPQIQLSPLRQQIQSFCTFLPVQNALIVSLVIVAWTLMFAALQWAWARSRASEKRLTRSLAKTVVEMEVPFPALLSAALVVVGVLSSDAVTAASPRRQWLIPIKPLRLPPQAEAEARLKAEAASTTQQGEFRAMVRCILPVVVSGVAFHLVVSGSLSNAECLNDVTHPCRNCLLCPCVSQPRIADSTERR